MTEKDREEEEESDSLRQRQPSRQEETDKNRAEKKRTEIRDIERQTDAETIEAEIR